MLNYDAFDPYANAFPRLRRPTLRMPETPEQTQPAPRGMASAISQAQKLYDSPEARAAQAEIAAQRPHLREEGAPPSIVPPAVAPDISAVKPPGQDSAQPPSPTQATATAAEPAAPAESEDEIDRVMKRLGKYIPSTDAYEEARKKFTEPAKPDASVGPWDIASFALPALLGVATGQPGYGFSSAAATLEGILGGKAARQQRYETQRQQYEQRVAQEADRLATEQSRRYSVLGPYVAETVAQRERGRLANAQMTFRVGQERFREQLESAKLHLDTLKLGTQQDLVRVRELEAQIRAVHERAWQALTQGRLDEYERHNRESETLMGQLRDIERSRISGAVSGGRLAPAQAATMVSNFDKRIAALQTDLALETDPTRRKEIEDEIAQYRNWRDEVGRRLGGALAPPEPGTKTMTRAELRQIARNNGISEAEAERQANLKGWTIGP